MVQVETIIEQADDLVGQEIDVEGIIFIIEKAKHKITFVSTAHEYNDPEQQQIFIDHSLADLKTIIRPLPMLQLMFRGQMTNPPYFYRFPANFRATVDMSADNEAILRNVSAIKLTIPYTGKTAELTLNDSYDYRAEVDYAPVALDIEQRTIRATVKSHKTLMLTNNLSAAELISEGDNRYVRRITDRPVQISGWLETTPSKNDIMSHMLFVTTSVRASVVAVGPLREETIIWIRPGGLYKLLKSHMPVSATKELHQTVEIIGLIDYLRDDDIPQIGEKSPKLVFNRIEAVIIHEENYLR